MSTLITGGTVVTATGNAIAQVVFGITQDGIAYVFTERYAERLRFCHDTGAWFEWTGAHWHKDNTQLAFGMGEEEAARALGTPLTYIRGRPGDETYLAIRDVGGTGFFNRKDRLYLQFRRGHLAGWKGDWGRNWMWQ